MPELTVTLTAGASAIFRDFKVPSNRWNAVIDHAALVTAKRSRADGYDLRMRHLITGNVGIVSAAGLNTASCTIVFVAAQNVNAGDSDGQYRVVFGNLGATAPTWGAANLGDVPADARATPAAPPAVALPSPGFSLDQDIDPDVDENAYPEFLATRRARRNQNSRPTFVIQYSNIQPEEWYEIRAFVRSLAGGARVFNPPSWLGSASDLFRLLAWRTEQPTRMQFMATVECEKVAA